MSKKKIEIEVPTIEVSNFATKYLQLTITNEETTVEVFIDPGSVDGLIKRLHSVKLEMKVLDSKASSRANF